MKAVWLRWAARIDALTLRERAMVAVGGVAGIVFGVYFGFTDPANARERTLRASIVQQRGLLQGVDTEIAQKQAAAAADPDAAARKRLKEVQAANTVLRAELRNTSRGLVQPSRMTALLQGMVQQNGRLKLVSLKTLPPAGTTDGNFAEQGEGSATAAAAPVLPVTPLSTTPPGGTAPVQAAATTTPAKDAPLLYRHGVQIVLQGAYGDMVAYMNALERMPAQLFWGRAVLDAAEHDKSTLTLTLYTLSLDDKWIAL
ncbi:MSHA biogenesis protein MshJ [Pseudoduganella lurida]|uniref:MSHA biogenesis protein MshJ n=1 Tax=Pseudoduganella lurida TaxID=1036180 RepID=A0A562RLW6_9BURK|nr:type II secretion system protein GspM [Pseudoduganella lurida]TWI69440.1 MSHA biogenesis protein MshJ [Pseudoduganella lurida]